MRRPYRRARRRSACACSTASSPIVMRAADPSDRSRLLPPLEHSPGAGLAAAAGAGAGAEAAHSRARRVGGTGRASQRAVVDLCRREFPAAWLGARRQRRRPADLADAPRRQPQRRDDAGADGGARSRGYRRFRTLRRPVRRQRRGGRRRRPRSLAPRPRRRPRPDLLAADRERLGTEGLINPVVSESKDMIGTSIVIITYRRPASLAATVACCLGQRGVEGGFETIVVDNDPAGSAHPVIEARRAEGANPRYVHEPRPGISYARNAGIAAAAGRYVAFIDDDEEAGPDWLAAHLKTIREANADISVGPVLPRFAAPAEAIPAYALRLFTRDARVPSGTPVPAWPGIGNTLLVRERCCLGDAPFDPAFGITGGGDAIFLGRLARAGRKIVWCAEAPLWETIPPDRVTPRYLLRRAFRGGQTTSYLHAAAEPPEPGRLAYRMLTGAAQAVCYGLPGFVFWLSGRPNGISLLARAAMGLGKVVWHPRLHVRLYGRRRDHGAV